MLTLPADNPGDGVPLVPSGHEHGRRFTEVSHLHDLNVKIGLVYIRLYPWVMHRVGLACEKPTLGNLFQTCGWFSVAFQPQHWFSPEAKDVKSLKFRRRGRA
ncbi:hypothetical protein FGB62_63g018 [Gracilaria domingensis]|nr:hypothetical protein FGB62_63g018 [Gracilaria domingensis]